MTDQVFNIAKGAFVEKIRDTGTNVLVLLLTVNEADAALLDHRELNALLGAAGNTEASDASYGRKTGITATLSIDDANERVDVDIPDQTWTALAGSAITKLIVAYEESAAETGRIPLSHHDFAVTPDGSDVTATITNFARAA